jgi:CBS domain-containing protein
MSRAIGDLVTRDVPVLRAADSITDAVAAVLASALPALPVAGENGRYAGVFGEREFLQALFPGYVGTLKSAGFLRRSIDEVLEKRAECAQERVAAHLNDEHVEVQEDFSDVQLAEVFLHHRVLIAPVLSGGQVIGVVTRADFFRALAERFLEDRG